MFSVSAEGFLLALTLALAGVTSVVSAEPSLPQGWDTVSPQKGSSWSSGPPRLLPTPPVGRLTSRFLQGCPLTLCPDAGYCVGGSPPKTQVESREDTCSASTQQGESALLPQGFTEGSALGYLFLPLHPTMLQKNLSFLFLSIETPTSCPPPSCCIYLVSDCTFSFLSGTTKLQSLVLMVEKEPRINL